MARISILVVEDENIVAKDIKDRLESLGYAVPGIVSSGEKALEVLAETHFDLVLMDIMLKGDMDGIQTADRIRESRALPVVYLTAYADQNTLERAKITEPYGYILKPFEERELHTSIEMALYKHKMENRLRESEQWFSTTLTCIGEAVIATNAGGRIRFINPIAEQLTGWDARKAIGGMLGDIFRLESETAGDTPPTDLLQTVRETGGVYAPPGNLLLSSRDGTQIPVEAKAAPIRDEHDTMTGVVVTFWDISDRRRSEEKIRRMNEELLRANDELKTLDKLKNNLLSNVSHELRTPLVAVRGYTEMIAGGFSGPVTDTQKHQLDISLKSIDRLVTLIDSLLDFSRLEQKHETLALERTDFTEIVSESLSLVMPKASSKNITLAGDIPDTPLELLADRNKIYQVMLNLLENAVKFTPDSGRITVRVERTQDNMVCCSVQDTGIGIRKDLLAQVFDRFYQVDSSSTRKFGGMGIGLAICQDIIKLHNGRIHVESEEGKGSTFTFVLPLVQASDAPPPEPDRGTPHGATGRVLVIDNDRDVRDALEKDLIDAGYRPVPAATGAEAMNLIRFEPVDAVLVDLAIRDMNGLDICRRITEKDPDACVILLSSQPPEKIEVKAARAGAAAVVRKPVDTAELLAALRLKDDG